MASDPAYEVAVESDEALEGPLLVGLSNAGLAGLTAVDYLVSHLEFEQVGHVRARGLPDITPVEDGVPRHPMRVYAAPRAGYCAVLSELFVPVWAADAFADGLLEWLDTTEIDELAVLHGIPYPHGPDEHDVCYVATPAYGDRRLDGADVSPASGGVLDGVAGELTARSLDGDAPPLGAYVTPTHPPGPDLEAALRYLDLLRTVYDLEIDDDQLRERAAELQRHYAELADRMATLEANEGAGSRSFPEDRMFM
ncbi:proteasome assembly chaperone family protein [Haloterrigena sp. SYSU A558-1]|uniref:Proteasome assembly chaperone family protein n=1 Tax=Haloterrigena gelatinilytica TaxID=2741724 RepID=A0A8J8KEF2_9EURY|nr:PAC2 family protein [Haloterrigena gelatinilytica]NUB89967.1 proteasome assembly chaperone family protein [Haloterrigena gelatinilytica]NUC74208.1 proteasome assembly chaperone family protein [Haloterrigena gelatinilytica]